MIIEVRNSKDDSFNRTITARDIIALTHTDELNGADMLSITTLAPLEPGQHLVLKIAGRLKEYTVQAPKATREGATVVYSDTALASIVDLFGVQPRYLGDDSALHADQLLERALAPAGSVWRVEFPDGDADAAIATISDLHYKSAREIVAKVAAAGGFEIETYLDDEADKRVIVMHKHRGSSEPTARFSFGKNLLKVERTQRAPEMTACYGFLKADYHGKRYQLFHDKYTTNKDADEQWAKRSCGGHVVGVYTSEEEDASKVEHETEGYLADHSVPQVTYEASVLELTQDNAPVQSVQVGDTVDIVDPTFKPTLRCRGRITKLESNLLSERTTVTLGNITRDLSEVIAGRNSKLQNSIAQAESAAQNVQKASEARIKNLEEQVKTLRINLGLFKEQDHRDLRFRVEKLEAIIREITGRNNL